MDVVKSLHVRNLPTNVLSLNDGSISLSSSSLLWNHVTTSHRSDVEVSRWPVLPLSEAHIPRSDLQSAQSPQTTRSVDTLHFQPVSGGIHVAFPCCIAATNAAFILKKASPLLLPPLMTHTSCRNLLTCTKERERGLVPRRACSATCSVYTEPVLISILVLSIRLEMQLYFIYFARPLDLIMHLFVQAVLLSASRGLQERA